MKKILFFLFAFLLFFVPLILWPFTSEVFEFNKIVLVYILTTLIVAVWIVRSITEGKFIFRRTLLDIPLLVFLGSQIISTVLSIDPQTSFFGYYSRFNGGLLSTICYSLLYWTFVSNFDAKETLNLIKVWLASAVLVSIYGILEHFGIDKNIWVQDVQSRVFSTLGQPNWLAAWIVALIPLTWSKSKLNYFLSILFFITLLFTKSRSGLLGFAVADLIYWGFVLIKDRKKYLKEFLIFNSIFLVLFFIIKTPTLPAETSVKTGPALETGGTESGTIRKIVWKGALQVWLHYPIFGSGVETFAYSYYQFRPAEHNLVSEWDFIYNKAHNEYLNLAANSGSFGLLSYLTLIGFAIFLMIKNLQFTITNLQTNPKFENSKNENLLKIDHWSLKIALLAGYVSLLITNFFGFSVVPTQLELFLFPAIAVACSSQNVEWKIRNETNRNQKILILCILLATFYLLLAISRYWYADILYARKDFIGAINLEPNQALYHNGLASSYATAKQADLAVSESQKAIDLSPANVNLKRSQFGVFIMLSTINQDYLLDARNALIDAIKLAPTDAKLYYNLGLVYARTGQTDSAIKILAKTVELKANYKDARLAYAFLLIDKKQNTEAKTQLEYILKNIDPNDSLTKQTLDSLK